MFLRSVTLLQDSIPDLNAYPFSVPAIRGMDAVHFPHEVYSRSTVVTGTAETNATVKVSVGETVLGSEIASGGGTGTGGGAQAARARRRQRRSSP